MIVIFNEAAYSQNVSSLEDASNIYWLFVETYTALKQDKRITNPLLLYGNKISIIDQIAHDGSRISDLQKIWATQYKGPGQAAFSLLLSVFSKLIPLENAKLPSKQFILDDVSLQIPEDDANSMLLSVATKPQYKNLGLQGILKDGSFLEVKNISKKSHIEGHRIALGIRKYERNPKHQETYTAMGKGLIASPMDLCAEEAQELLNRAIIIDKGRTLYAATNGKCYVFPEHEPGKAIYHGYLDEHPTDKVCKALGLK